MVIELPCQLCTTNVPQRSRAHVSKPKEFGAALRFDQMMGVSTIYMKWVLWHSDDKIVVDDMKTTLWLRIISHCVAFLCFTLVAFCQPNPRVTISGRVWDDSTGIPL